MPLFEEVKLAARYDVAIMSTKGMSVTASRKLVDDLCGAHDIPLLVPHDFDKAGFSIAGTLRRDTRRYTFANDIQVIDLGLRLEDIDGLETEEVYTQSPRKARWNLKENGATEEEIDFLPDPPVQLTAFAIDDLVNGNEGHLLDRGKTFGDQKVSDHVVHIQSINEHLRAGFEFLGAAFRFLGRGQDVDVPTRKLRGQANVLPAPADGERELFVGDHHPDAVGLLVQDHLGDFGRGQGVDEEGRSIGRPLNDVDFVALKLADDGLPPRAALADTEADRVEAGVAVPHGGRAPHSRCLV